MIIVSRRYNRDVEENFADAIWSRTIGGSSEEDAGLYVRLTWEHGLS
jgi:hypothetical protein